MNAAVYRERKLANLCAYSVTCPESTDGDSPWCEQHRRWVRILRARRNRAQWRRQRARASRRRWRQRRAADGLCTRCCGFTHRRTYLCDRCAQEHDARYSKKGARP